MFRSVQLLSSLAFCSMAMFIVSCKESQHSVDEKYYLVATNIKLPYWEAAGAGMLRAAAQMHVQAQFVGPDTYDPKAQQAEFQKVVGQKPTGILISPADPALMQPEIDRAIGQGIPVITIDSDARSSKRLLFIGTDNYKAGQMGGEVLAKSLQGKGNVIVLSMPEQANLKDRLRGYQDALALHPQIKIVEVLDIRGNPGTAFDKTTEIMEKRAAKVDAFACLEAVACPEVAEVLNRKKADKVVVAMDVDPLTLQWIQKGKVTATIGQKPFTMAYFGIKMLDDLHHHKITPLDANWAKDPFSPIPSLVDTGATLIDKSNVEAFLRDLAAVKQ
jgi:ribose transport system substrate-binding protein